MSSPELQATMARCTSWQEIYYDPSSGLRPSEYDDRWKAIYEGCSVDAIVDGKLRITNSDLMEACYAAAGYVRSEPSLSLAPIYLMQMGVQIVGVGTYIGEDTEPALWFSSVLDGERTGYAALTYFEADPEQPVAALGTFSTANPVLASMPWDFFEATRYTYLAERNGDVSLEVGEEAPLRAFYSQLAPTWDPSSTEVSFRVRGAVAEISYIRVCICEDEAPSPTEPILIDEPILMEDGGVLDLTGHDVVVTASGAIQVGSGSGRLVTDGKVVVESGGSITANGSGSEPGGSLRIEASEVIVRGVISADSGSAFSPFSPAPSGGEDRDRRQPHRGHRRRAHLRHGPGPGLLGRHCSLARNGPDPRHRGRRHSCRQLPGAPPPRPSEGRHHQSHRQLHDPR